MTRTTVDFGIDLGTTNSAAAVLEGTEPRIIKNINQMDYTPSAVLLDLNLALIVGKTAKERAGTDYANVCTGFKRDMGTPREFPFARDGRVLRAEDLSAEVLKDLKTDIQRDIGEEPRAAVITVPAAFEQPQCDATRLAAEKAGLRQSPLLQEPVAASLAYGFQEANENTFWLVYDLGGGTFDAAVVSMRDGVFQIVNHLGDNYLGGKDIDRKIVDELLLPALWEQHGLVDLKRGADAWIGALAKLELAAEEAKIAVSQRESASIQVQELRDNLKNVVLEDFVFELHRGDVERLMESQVERSLDLSRKVLAEKGLGPDDLEKVLLVGGPTLAPYVRQRLADLGGGIDRRLEYRISPLTVVARGAAVFAGTQKLIAAAPRAVPIGGFRISLEYKPIGADSEPLVGGVVKAADGADLSGYTIEFVNQESRPQWRSGRIGLAPTGAFMANLWAEKGRGNTFAIELADGEGALQTTEPDHLTYTVGNVFSEVPLPHNIGVALANNEVEWFFRKGDPLPAKKRKTLHTAFDAHAGNIDEAIRIDYLEGLSDRADRNTGMGDIAIACSGLARNVPAGSEVEVTISIDASRNISAEVYIPLIDESFEAVYDTASYGARAHDAGQLETKVKKEKKRLADLREKAEETGEAKAQDALARVDGERLVQDIDSSAAAMSADQDAANRCEKRLRDLQMALDEAEAALEWPSRLSDAEHVIELGQHAIDDFGDDDDRERFQRLVAQVRDAMRSHDADLLEQRTDELRSFAYGILDERGILQMWWLDAFKERVGEMRDQARAQELLQRADRAKQTGDIEALRAANRQLSELLPSPPPPPDASWLLR